MPTARHSVEPLDAPVRGPTRTSVQDFDDPTPSSRTSSRVVSLLARRQRIQPADLENAQPFTWSGCLVSLFSYALLLSDVFRSGLAIRKEQIAKFPLNEPDSILHFGPYEYPVVHLSLSNASIMDASTTMWAYKYDTTSISMRSVVEHLQVPNWPPCVLYNGDCSTTGRLPHRIAYHMIHSFCSGTAAQPRDLRAQFEWFDRMYHFAFPWFFHRDMMRTTQAIYYRINDSRHVPKVCGQAATNRPYAGDEPWTRHRPDCVAENDCAGPFDSVWTRFHRHLSRLVAANANYSIDFVPVEGVDDYTKPGLALQGRKNADIVLFTRVRDCTASPLCQTVLVDDYRFEAGHLAINAPDWFTIVALIRCLGQAYAWLRLIFLVVGTFAALKANEEPHAPQPLQRRLIHAFRTVFIIPSQIIIYGSLFPILCYVTAHLLDSSAV